ncbi:MULTISPECIES: thioesterase family protein [unclassified Tatumella]|uniref:thioesterase family protein n=1 Tax=unclassified Tatumella TaxID=2649542 RepID=UPI001BAFCA0B|nr:MULTISPECIES: thioesterase family protein [unclassified Tatumella]MBS0857163.1 thioesterase family protein [Tatumella sp. JGM16]MBS0878530.1 thioesterase family protein [Tatumella sp. JGM82]MBS0892122.1 thioesterase family protein [Tatumella sp. JGM94]MBS0894023.1 thioesterase family protein [Tatumella sp. JGM130]MBS0903221.1 thioesterase family protein [Tatumella sp. JGM100]
MSLRYLTQHQARTLVSDIFVNSMPFNRALGLKLEHLDDQQAILTLENAPSLVGNALQNILHGGVIASVLDVAAGLVCVNHALTRQDMISEEELRQRISRMGTIDLRVDYLRPGRGEKFIATAQLLRAGNKVAVGRVELHNQQQDYIATATATYLIG